MTDLPTQVAARTKRPIQADWELTQACPWDCRHCYLGEKRPRGRLSLDECRRILEQLAEAGVIRLVLTGGEPTLFPHFWELPALARWFGFRLRLFSVLSHLDDERLDRLAAEKFELIEVSLLGSTPALHDRLVRRPGAFDGVVRAVERLVARGAKVRLKTVFFPENFTDRGNTQKLAAHLGCAYGESFEVLHRTDTAETPESGRLSAEDWKLLSCSRREELRRAHRPRPPEQTHGCGAGARGWAVNPEGEVYPCLILRLSCGNLLRQGFREIYAHPVMRALREEGALSPEACRSCTLQPFCRRCKGQAWLETGDWRKPARLNCRTAAAVREALAKPAAETVREKKPAPERKPTHVVARG